MAMSKNQANAVLSRMSVMLQKEFGENFDIKFAKTTFDTNGKINFKFSLADKTNATMIKESDTLLGMRKNGVHVDAIGVEFTLAGKKHTIESVSTRKQKYCVTAKREDGKRFRYPAKFINEQVRIATGVTFVGWHK